MNRGGENETREGRVWPALSVEQRRLSELKLSKENPREHTLEQIELISESMDQFGWTMPILIDEENGVIAGHGRIRAARLKGWEFGPVVIARGWSANQKMAYMIADNRLAERSDWDTRSLKVALRDLRAAEFPMDLVGFSAEDLNKLVLEEPPKSGEPTEVVMVRCPHCGHLSRKNQGGEIA